MTERWWECGWRFRLIGCLIGGHGEVTAAIVIGESCIELDGGKIGGGKFTSV